METNIDRIILKFSLGILNFHKFEGPAWGINNGAIGCSLIISINPKQTCFNYLCNKHYDKSKVQYKHVCSRTQLISTTFVLLHKYWLYSPLVALQIFLDKSHVDLCIYHFFFFLWLWGRLKWRVYLYHSVRLKHKKRRE